MKRRDLFVAVADLDAENAIRALLGERQRALHVQLDFRPQPPPQGDMLRYTGRDSGCYKDAVDLLRAAQQTHQHALLIFDRHGCGASDKSRQEIEAQVEGRLQRNGWKEDAASVIVIEPELESWVWAQSPQVAGLLGWGDEPGGLRPFLEGRGLWSEDAPKPADPKAALRAALRRKNKPLGARVFSDLASRVSVARCQDPAFQKLCECLRRWFPNKRHR
jgi:hypothetical protein